jgi:hypothetical protein
MASNQTVTNIHYHYHYHFHCNCGSHNENALTEATLNVESPSFVCAKVVTNEELKCNNRNYERRSKEFKDVNRGGKWKNGNIITLTSISTGRNLKINKEGVVEASGGQGKWSQFEVIRTESGTVKLKCVGHENAFLRIKNEETIDTGHGGNFCEFRVVKHFNKNGKPVVSLESVKVPNCRVGFRKNGTIKPPKQTWYGPCGSFSVNVLSKS